MNPKVILPQGIELPSISFFNLPNGIPIYYVHAPHLEVLEIQFVFNAGSLFQSKKLQARFTASMLFEGTENYNSKALAEQFDYLGTFVHANADKDYSTVTMYVTSDKLKDALPLFEEVIKHPTFPSGELNKIINESKQEFEINQEKNSYIARINFLQNLFGSNHPYGANASIEDYNSIKTEDLIAFYKEWYNYSNCKIFISGNVDESVLTLMNETFGDKWGSGINNQFVNNEQINSKLDKCFIEKEKALQSAIRIGCLTIDRKHDDYNKLQIVNTIFGGYFGSRLMKNIREDKGYTYGIGSGLVSLKNHSYITINTEVKAEVTQKALDEIYKEMRLIKTDLVSLKEIELVRNYLIGEVYRSIDGPFNLLDKWKGLILNDFDATYFQNLFGTLISINPDEVKRIANNYFLEEKMLEVVVGKK